MCEGKCACERRANVCEKVCMKGKACEGKCVLRDSECERESACEGNCVCEEKCVNASV